MLERAGRLFEIRAVRLEVPLISLKLEAIARREMFMFIAEAAATLSNALFVILKILKRDSGVINRTLGVMWVYLFRLHPWLELFPLSRNGIEIILSKAFNFLKAQHVMHLFGSGILPSYKLRSQLLPYGLLLSKYRLVDNMLYSVSN